MTTTMIAPAMSTEALESRYRLLCRACHTDVDDSPVQHQLATELKQLQTILLQDLPALARRGSPDNFADLWENLKQELERFHEFCEFPDLAQKVVVGLGGAFSAGKSSFINALLGQKRLVTEVDETTSLPTYLLHGSEEHITALNLFKRRVRLSQAEFLSLTHDEKLKYGSQVSALLYSAFVSVPEFTFRNLALLDTPGYSKPDDPHWHERSDAHLARSQLNSAQFLIWLISAEAGTISEADLKFLASLRPGIPRLIIISRADKRTPQDMENIVTLVRTTLANRALPALDVIPISVRKPQQFPLTPILKYLETWNAAPQTVGFAVNFKRQFNTYQCFLDNKQYLARRRLNRLNLILSLSDDEDIISDAQDLRDLADRELHDLQKISEDLQGLSQRFFHGLKKIGSAVGIPLPEPDADDSQQYATPLLNDPIFDRLFRENQNFSELSLSDIDSSNDTLLIPKTFTVCEGTSVYFDVAVWLSKNNLTREMRRRPIEVAYYGSGMYVTNATIGQTKWGWILPDGESTDISSSSDVYLSKEEQQYTNTTIGKITLTSIVKAIDNLTSIDDYVRYLENNNNLHKPFFDVIVKFSTEELNKALTIMNMGFVVDNILKDWNVVRKKFYEQLGEEIGNEYLTQMEIGFGRRIITGGRELADTDEHDALFSADGLYSRYGMQKDKVFVMMTKNTETYVPWRAGDISLCMTESKEIIYESQLPNLFAEIKGIVDRNSTGVYKHRYIRTADSKKLDIHVGTLTPIHRTDREFLIFIQCMTRMFSGKSRRYPLGKNYFILEEVF